MRHLLLLIATSSSLLALSQTAVFAQAPADEAVPPPSPAATRTPSCRSGYVCVAGTCVSQCNPACGAGERCHAGECAALPRAVPPCGVAARFWYTHATDKEGGLDITFDVSGFAILFSATYQ